MQKKNKIINYNSRCAPCEAGNIEPLTREQAEGYLIKLPGWVLSPDAKTISKMYRFLDFIGAINFVSNVAELAESEGHHPDITINYNKVTLSLSTHAIGGLSENDFILATKIDK